MTTSASGPAADPFPIHRSAPGGGAPRGALAGAGQDFAGVLAAAGGGQTGAPVAAGQPQATVGSGASAPPAPAPSLPGPPLPGPAPIGPLPPGVAVPPGPAPGAVPGKPAAAKVDGGKLAPRADEDPLAPERAASKADDAACAGPASLPETPGLSGLNWSGQAVSPGGTPQPGAAAASGGGAGAPTMDAAPTQGAGFGPAGPASPGVLAPDAAAGKQAGQSIAGVIPNAAPPPAITSLVGTAAASGGVRGGGPQPPTDPNARPADQDATSSVTGVQATMPHGIAATGAAKPGIPGARSPAPADGAAPAQRDDGVQSSGTLPPGGPRSATAASKAPVPAGSAQTEPSGAGAAEHTPGATEGAAPQAAGDLANPAEGPAFLMPAMPAEAPSPGTGTQGTGAPALSQAASPMHAAPSLPTPDQLRPAFAAVAAATGPSHVIVRLDPAELGRVQVGILRQPDGPSRIELVAERPETLQLLMRDQPALHRALDLAGVPAEGRTLHFQVGSPDLARDPAPTPEAQSGLAGGSMNSPGGGGSQAGSGRGQPPAWSGPPVRGAELGTHLPHPAFRSPHGLRAGVDITA